MIRFADFIFSDYCTVWVGVATFVWCIVELMK
jgi:hypothetical protein